MIVRSLVATGRGGAALLLTPAAALAQPAVPPVPDEVPGESELIVTAAAVPVASETVGRSFTVIDRDTIERRKIAYLADVLRTVPGIAVNRSGSFGAPTQVRIRGAEGNHTLVLVDGIEVSSIGEGEFDFASLLAGNIERVEVLRGPQSGLYGANALAGVVNVITRGADGPTFDGAAEAGSFGTVFGRGTVTAGERDQFLAVSGLIRTTDGISTAAIGNEDDGDRNLTAYARGGLAIGPAVRLDGSFRFTDRHTDTDGFDFSGGPNQGLAVDDDSFADTQETSGGLSLAIEPASGVETVITGAYTDYRLVGGSGASATFGNTGQRLKFGARANVSFAAHARFRHSATAFADYEDETYRNTFPADPTQVPAQRRDILGIGAEYRLAFDDRMFVKAAIRHDSNNRFADATTYSFAGSWLMPRSGTRFHASYGKGVANPTFSEQFGFIPGTFEGNPGLAPEHSLGFDIGVEQRVSEALLLDLTYFEATLEDEIVNRFPTVVNDTGTSERSGLEFSARGAVGPIDLGVTYTYLDAIDPDGTREIRRPEHQASVDASAGFGPERRGNMSLGVIYNGQMLDDDFRDYYINGFMAEKTPLDEYVLVRLAATYRVTPRIELFGRAENLLDEDYREVLGYGTPGLSAYAGLRVIVE